MCNYTHSLEGLGNGNVAVFTVGFNVSMVKDLRRKGVLIAYESGESPVHMPSLRRVQLEQVRHIISSLLSYVAALYETCSFLLIGSKWMQKSSRRQRKKIPLNSRYHNAMTFHWIITWAFCNIHHFQISLFITLKSDSHIPLIYALYIRNGGKSCEVTREERDAMTQGNFVHLLPSYHRQRRGLVAWAVSNHRPNNTRDVFFKALSRFINVSTLY